jgi:hypothetical protein
MCVYPTPLRSPLRAKDRIALADVSLVQRGRFRAAGVLSAGRRRPQVDTTAGLRLVAPSGGSVTTLRGPRRWSSAPGDPAAEMADMELAAAEMAAVCRLVQRDVADNRVAAIDRAPRLGTGLRSAGFNSSGKGHPLAKYA